MAEVDNTRPGKRFKPLTGRFGRLTVVRFHGYLTQPNGNRTQMWVFRCDCGQEVIARRNDVVSGHKNSCNCLQREMISKRTTTHGHTAGGNPTPEFRAWLKMKERCYNENFDNYRHYGGRGITVCQRWLDSFEDFLADVGLRPSPSHSLDRFPNRDGDYEPGNVRWANRVEQQNNKNTNHFVTALGKTMTLAEWETETGIRASTIRQRISRLGWSQEKAVTTPSGKNGRKGRRNTIAGIASSAPPEDAPA